MKKDVDDTGEYTHYHTPFLGADNGTWRHGHGQVFGEIQALWEWALIILQVNAHILNNNSNSMKV